MATQQFDPESAIQWEYRRAFLLPDMPVSINLPGDQLVRAIAALEKESPTGWQVVRLKASADDRGRAWFDLLLKNRHPANQVAEPSSVAACQPYSRLRAA